MPQQDEHPSEDDTIDSNEEVLKCSSSSESLQSKSETNTSPTEVLVDISSNNNETEQENAELNGQITPAEDTDSCNKSEVSGEINPAFVTCGAYEGNVKVTVSDLS